MSRLVFCAMFSITLLFVVISSFSPADEMPSASSKPRFNIPVWHPDARWKPQPRSFALDSNVRAHLDGPRHEVMMGHPIYPRLRGGMQGVGRQVFMAYDSRRERYHAVTGGAAGYLDGPFSRARLYVSDYHTGRHERAWSPDGRFYYLLASFAGQRIRSLDFATQMVRTLPTAGVAFACGESGKLYIVQGASPAKKVVILSPGPEWKVLRTVDLKGEVKLSLLGSSLAVDEKQGRLYATTYRASPWYIWYWDLSDGTVHGVLPIAKDKSKARKPGEAGPFEGTVMYNHGEISWGPDDPDKRFLYVTRVDEYNLYRLDLKRRMVAVFNEKEGRFVEQGRAEGRPIYMYPPHWFADGSFLAFVPYYTERGPYFRYYQRIR